MTLQQTCSQMLEDDFKSEFQTVIASRHAYNNLYSTFSIMSILCIGSTTILAFISAPLHLPALSIAAGCTGVLSSALHVYSNFCKTQYESNTKIIEEMTTKINITDILTDNTKYMAADGDKTEENLVK